MPFPDADDFVALAQRAAEARLDAAFTVMAADNGYEDDEVTEAELEEAAEQLAAPFCGCTRCIVREVLDAAYQPMVFAEIFSPREN